MLARTAAPNQSWRAVARATGASGERSWAEIRYEPITGAGGELLFGVTTVHDVTSIKQAEFVPLQLNLGDTAAGAPGIVIEIRRGAAMVTVRWPVSAAAECATWLQGWLR